MGAQYRAFLSYSHRDAKWANWLHRALETYRPPKALVGTTTAVGVVPRRLIPIFQDRQELASATELGAVINAALRDSACQIVICSPDAARSRWVNEEILAFKRLGREDRIFPLIVSGEPNASSLPGRESEECFPPALRFHLGADGNLSDAPAEPVAADARPGKDGKSAGQAETGRGGSGGWLRRAAAARAAAPQPPFVRRGVRGHRWHGADHWTRHLRAHSALHRAEADRACGKGGRRGGADHELSHRAVPPRRPERGARQHGHGARDAGPGQGARGFGADPAASRFRRVCCRLSAPSTPGSACTAMRSRC